MPATAHGTLRGALGVEGPGGLVAFVGGGGKSTAIRMLAGSIVAQGERVLVTTTTAMMREELTQVGPLVLANGNGRLRGGLVLELARCGVASAGETDGPGCKIIGVSPATVDQLCRAELADWILVEADGSRRRSLKMFASYEPQVPAQTTTLVLLAGVDVLGSSLTEDNVQRACLLATTVGQPVGSPVDRNLLTCALRVKVRRLRTISGCRVVAVLNKADTNELKGEASAIAKGLLTPSQSGDGAQADGAEGCPDAVVVSSLHRDEYVQFTAPVHAGEL